MFESFLAWAGVKKVQPKPRKKRKARPIVIPHPKTTDCIMYFLLERLNCHYDVYRKQTTYWEKFIVREKYGSVRRTLWITDKMIQNADRYGNVEPVMKKIEKFVLSLPKPL